jgi:hypothetical protein
MKTLKQIHAMHSREANVCISSGLQHLQAAGISTPDKLTAHALDRTLGVGASTARGLVAVLALEVARLQRMLDHINQLLEANK